LGEPTRHASRSVQAARTSPVSSSAGRTARPKE
jgi:hypothetical protein